jgi:thioredoxin-like negative regulator of GroEL
VEFLLATDDQALEAALARCRLAVVFFSGRQCAVCVNFERMLRSICRGYREVCCIKAYSESVLSHVKQLGIFGVPSLVGYVDGRPVARSVGLPYAPAVNMLMASLLRAAHG